MSPTIGHCDHSTPFFLADLTPPHSRLRPPSFNEVGTPVHLIPLIMDSRLSLGGDGSAPDTLLTLPFGTGSVLDYLAGGLEGCGSSRTLIYTASPASDAYEQRLRASSSGHLQVLQPADLAEFAENSETSDFLFIVDPRRWPTAGYDLAELMRRGRRYRGATHAGGHRRRPRTHARNRRTRPAREGQTGETVVQPDDLAGDPVHRRVPFDRSRPGPPRCQIFLAGRAFGRSWHRRVLFTQDLPVRSDVHDLSDEGGVLALNESMVQQVLNEPVQDGYSMPKPDVLVGRGCRIDATANLVGPLIVQEDAVIEAGATIIGPGLVGRGAARVRERGGCLSGDRWPGGGDRRRVWRHPEGGQRTLRRCGCERPLADRDLHRPSQHSRDRLDVGQWDAVEITAASGRVAVAGCS